MKITKFGHCCMLIEENGVRMLVDPGTFTADTHASLVKLDAILFTHEHADHYHLQSLQTLVHGNPQAVILCNASVATLLVQANIQHQILSDGQSAMVKNVAVEAHGTTHAVVHASMPPMQNTGFFIGGRLWYPGDELTVDPGVRPDIMALPVAGPWMKISEAIDYALKLQPKSVFPVHDMLLSDIGHNIHERIATSTLEPRGVRFYPIELAREYEF